MRTERGTLHSTELGLDMRDEVSYVADPRTITVHGSAKHC